MQISKLLLVVSVSLSLSVSVGATRAHFRHSSPFCSGHHFVFFFFSLASELLSQNDKIALELAHSPMHFLFAYLSLCLPPSRYPAILFFPASLSLSLAHLLASHTRKPLDNFLFFFLRLSALGRRCDSFHAAFVAILLLFHVFPRFTFKYPALGGV